MSPTNFPDLPLLSLDTAEESSTLEVLKGKNTVFDFWTTRCVRCPAALDKMDKLAAEALEDGHDVQFISICCGDSCDDAREILEKPRERRWSNVKHYFMDFDNKEKAKKSLGFKAVPFYVMTDKQGEIVQSGNTVDWDRVPGLPQPEEKENIASPVAIKASVESRPSPVAVNRAFELDDLDF